MAFACVSFLGARVRGYAYIYAHGVPKAACFLCILLGPVIGTLSSTVTNIYLATVITPDELPRLQGATLTL